MVPEEEKDPGRPRDADIIRRVLEGDVDVFEQLMVRYRDPVLRIVKRHVPQCEVEEVAHVAFIRAYRSLSTFRKSGRFKQWISAIAVRTCHDYWRKVYRSREVPMSSLGERQQNFLEQALSDRSRTSFDEKAVRKEAEEILKWGLDRLSPGDRMVLELVYLEGLSTREAAELLGWSTANVKVRSFRARKKMQRLLTGYKSR